MIWIGIGNGNDEAQFIDVNIWHTQAVYELLKEKLWNELNSDEQDSLNGQFEFFEDVFLGEWRDDVFNKAYQILMASENEFITPLRDDFERAFKIDPRFKL